MAHPKLLKWKNVVLDRQEETLELACILRDPDLLQLIPQVRLIHFNSPNRNALTAFLNVIHMAMAIYYI